MSDLGQARAPSGAPCFSSAAQDYRALERGRGAGAVEARHEASAEPAGLPETPTGLAAAGYRIEFGDPGRLKAGEIGRYWWTWSVGSALACSDGDWASAHEAVVDATRDQWAHQDLREPTDCPVSCDCICCRAAELSALSPLG